MRQDFNSTGSLLERIALEPEKRIEYIDEAVTGVEERICSFYGGGADGNTRFEHLRRRLMEYGSYEAKRKEATAMGLKGTINVSNGFDLDLINQIFIARFQDFEALMSDDFPAVFDEADVNFLSGEARLLRNEVTIYRNLSLIVNRGKRELNGDYSNAKKGRANKQFGEFRKMSELVVGGVEFLLAERYNIETEFRRFGEQPTYEQYQTSLSSIEKLRAKISEASSGIKATSIKRAAEYLMELCDHYASIINYEFLKNLKPGDVVFNEANLREIRHTSSALVGRRISRLASPQIFFAAWLPPLDAEVARFYENRNIVAYFADLRKSTSTQN